MPLTDLLTEELTAQGFAPKDFQLLVRQVEEPSAFREAARDLIKEGVHVLWADSAAPARAAKAETREIPIVFGIGLDPVHYGLVESIARPGGNVTGIAVPLLADKRLELLKDLVPQVRRVLVTMEPGWTAPSFLQAMQELRVAAQQLDITLLEEPLASKDDIERLPDLLKRQQVDGVLHIFNSAVNQHVALMVRILDEARVPDIHYYLPAVELGGYMAAYGPSLREAYQMSVQPLAKILRGAKPQDLPVESPDRIELHINLRLAKERGVEIPQTILIGADKVFR